MRCAQGPRVPAHKLLLQSGETPKLMAVLCKLVSGKHVILLKFAPGVGWVPEKPDIMGGFGNPTRFLKLLCGRFSGHFTAQTPFFLSSVVTKFLIPD